MSQKINTVKQTFKEKMFYHNGKQYIARLYKPEGKSSVYGEIVYSTTGVIIKNAKSLVREILKPYGIEISTNPNVINTHQAIKELIRIIETQGEKL